VGRRTRESESVIDYKRDRYRREKGGMKKG
jgi:hypothetical protein